jgi:hypothetical protein
MAVIRHEGRTLQPLTPDVIRNKPDFDPWQHDESVLRNQLPGWPRPRLIRSACRPGDDLYYWDGPWGDLSGSCGIAVVRDGHVVDTFVLWIS